MPIYRKCQYTGQDRTKFAVDTRDGELMVYCFTDDLKPYQVGQEIIATQRRNSNSWNLDPKATAALYSNPNPREEAHLNQIAPGQSNPPNPRHQHQGNHQHRRKSAPKASMP